MLNSITFVLRDILSKKKEVNTENYSSKVIFTYSTRHLAVKDKVRFYYALKGRDGKSGIIKKYSVEQLGRTVLLVDSRFQSQVEEFLRLWKCKFKKKKVLVENA